MSLLIRIFAKHLNGCRKSIFYGIPNPNANPNPDLNPNPKSNSNFNPNANPNLNPLMPDFFYKCFYIYSNLFMYVVDEFVRNFQKSF